MEEEALILHLETSGNTCSVALSKGENVLVEELVNEANAHSKLLIPMAQTLLQSQSIKPSDLQAVSISEGPGSYTGLRIGASFAKALCYANKIPLIAINTLEAWARAGKREDPNALYYAGLIDARRQDIYLAVYRSDLQADLEPDFFTIDDDLVTRLASYHQLVLCGSGSAKLAEQLNGQEISWNESLELKASDLIEPAFSKFKKQDFVDYVYFEPNYIKSVHITSKKQ